jgi:hypothetical protein
MSSQINEHFYSLDNCWACGAIDGAYEPFLNEYLLLCFSEPIDARFPADLGYQIMCSACSVGYLTMHLPEPSNRRRSYTAGWPRCSLSISIEAR